MALIRASFGLFGWLTCGNAKAYLRPKYANRSGPPKCHHSSQYVGRSKVVDLGRIWARIKINVAQILPVLLYLVYSWLTLGLPFAFLWPKFGKHERTAQVPSFHVVCGPDESVRCGPDLGLRNYAIWDVFSTRIPTCSPSPWAALGRG